MTLRDVIETLGSFDADQIIYVAGYTPQAEAIVDYETSDGDMPASASGMRYLLEVSLARDSIRVWSEWRDGRVQTLDEKVQTVIYYAENDAFMPVA